MNGTDVATWTRRRFGTLTGASLLLATATGTRRTAAKAKGNSGKTCRKQIDQTCKKQRQPCHDYWAQVCGFDPECTASYAICCAHLAGCKATKYYECIAPTPRA
jgi:hypothetical protein